MLTCTPRPMDDNSERASRHEARRRHNREFFEQLRARRPELAEAALERVRREAPTPDAAGGPAILEGLEEAANLPPIERVFETIVREERPVLFVQDDWLNTTEVTLRGEEAKELVDGLGQHRDRLMPLMPLVGRIDVNHFPGLEYVGTGWFVAEDVVVTNRHVASLIAEHDGRRFSFSRGVGGRQMEASLCTAHEFDDLRPDQGRIFEISDVLYIEPSSLPNDIAFLKVRRRTDGTSKSYIDIADANVDPNTAVLVVGYPARASKRVIPDQALMKELYRDRFDVKRAAPGFTMGSNDGTTRHDCTTLGGNSGSVVLDLKSGRAVGLHFAGLYQESNFALPADVLRDYVARKRWTLPARIESSRPSDAERGASSSRIPPRRDASRDTASRADDRTGSVTGSITGSITIPLSIPLTMTLAVGAPVVSGRGDGAGGGSPAARRANVTGAEAAARKFWDERPEGVVAVRVGFDDEDGEIGEVPIVAVSVQPRRLAEVEAGGPTHLDGVTVRYFPADATEQAEATLALEAVDEIAYDDDARTGADFSFAPVEEEMTVQAHVGPEYSWDVLKEFLAGGPQGSAMVSAIYEFHAKHIADALQERLDEGGSLQLVMDNASFSKVKHPDEEFDRVERFAEWEERFGDRFQRIVAPEGASGLIANAYHIKVTVREDDTFWLSSGNWKAGSSQPIIDDEQRADAADVDLPGNREWHVVVRSRTLSRRFRNHILQDIARSEELGGGTVPRSHESMDLLVDVPVEEGVELERRPPGRVLEPAVFEGVRKVRPLLTPDREGAVYSQAVLQLIRSAKKSLLFQIPYIAMPASPREDRGFIDELIAELTRKLKSLDDARLILRSGGSRLSAPTHAAWYLKSKGVDIASRVRQIENHHTKGMIVDGRRVLVGSHNWSKPGVTLNRDASLIFDDEEIAAYYAEAFEIDWDRANPVRPRRFVKSEAVVLEAVGDAPPRGFRRVHLRELLEGDD